MPCRPLLVVLLAALVAGGCSRAEPAGGRTAAPTPGTATPATAGSATTTGPAPTTGGPASAATGRSPTTAAARPRYRFPVAGCRVSYGRFHHDYPATDIMAARGCRFVSPVDGRVDEVSRVDRWSGSSNRGADRGGRSVSVVGVDGVRYYGSHLEWVAPGITTGTPVAAGQLLGRVGDTGSARGGPTHLHFGLSWPTPPGIWWVRRGVLYPWRYLDAWRAGHDLSPAPAVRAARRQAGQAVPPCRAGC